ncbi:hypothetical protein B0H17DRAFT_1187602 [Mycena rosella]|uniref:Uncharacterized protein n=1 Tax=Mycena rosella TaxID=1033263 RepID=A0AAD7BVV2_MYCRO|nr:hypothetical protein B0H17DRAFT_1187602 [Mycena rosella]
MEAQVYAPSPTAPRTPRTPHQERKKERAQGYLAHPQRPANPRAHPRPHHPAPNTRAYRGVPEVARPSRPRASPDPSAPRGARVCVRGVGGEEPGEHDPHAPLISTHGAPPASATRAYGGTLPRSRETIPVPARAPVPAHPSAPYIDVRSVGARGGVRGLVEGVWGKGAGREEEGRGGRGQGRADTAPTDSATRTKTMSAATRRNAKRGPRTRKIGMGESIRATTYPDGQRTHAAPSLFLYQIAPPPFSVDPYLKAGNHVSSKRQYKIALEERKSKPVPTWLIGAIASPSPSPLAVVERCVYVQKVCGVRRTWGGNDAVVGGRAMRVGRAEVQREACRGVGVELDVILYRTAEERGITKEQGERRAVGGGDVRWRRAEDEEERREGNRARRQRMRTRTGEEEGRRGSETWREWTEMGAGVCDWPDDEVGIRCGRGGGGIRAPGGQTRSREGGERREDEKDGGARCIVDCDME